MTNPSAYVLSLKSGKTTQPIQVGQANMVVARAGEQYRLVKVEAGQEDTPDGLVARRQGNALHIEYTDGTRLVLENFYVECAGAACSMTVPGRQAQGFVLTADTPPDVAAGDAPRLVYAHGDPDLLTRMEQESGVLHTSLADLPRSEVSFFAVASALGAAGDPGMLRNVELAPGAALPPRADTGTRIGGGGPARMDSTSGGSSDGIGGGGGTGVVTPAVDSTPPTLIITDDEGGTANIAGADITYTFTFDEAVSGFTANSITVSNATKGSFAALSATVYTLVVTPTAGFEGNVTVDVAAAGATDAAGNANTAATQSVQVADTLAPGAPSLGSVATDDTVNAAETSSTVSGTNESGATVALSLGGNTRNATVSGTTWTYTLVASDITAMGQGAETLSVAQTDAAGNTSAATTRAISIDSIAPTLASSTPADNGNALSVGADLVLTFSDNVFAGAGNIVISNGTDTRTIAIGDTSQVTISGTQVTLNPAANLSANTSYSVQIAPGALLDAVGNAYAGIADATALNFNTPHIELADIAAGAGGFVIRGQTTGDQSGSSVASAGDVNGDGLADLIVGAPRSNQGAPGTLTNSGRSYVVFGQTGTTAVELSAINSGTGGFSINGHTGGDLSGASVAAAGDINGDGLADLIVGAPGSDFGGNGNSANSGRSYVVFGKTGTAAVHLSAIAAGTGGFVINGESAQDTAFGMSVASAGDVNGDGLVDLIVGARDSDSNGNLSGRSYVVFGKTGTAAVHLTAIAAGTGGFVINSQGASDNSGISVAGAGDVNGDGLADLIVGAPNSDPAATSNAGRSYVVFGTALTAAVDLTAVAAGNGGFVINGQSANDASGFNVAGAGDVNGDGLADLVVGAPNSDPAGLSDAGRSYVVFGQTGTAPINLSAIAAGTGGGFVIQGHCANDAGTLTTVTSTLIASAGDINGDGLSDLLVGAGGSDIGSGGSEAGRTYVVFGKTSLTEVNLSAVAAGNGGFVISGQGASDNSGLAVAGAGDVNGDGLDDLIVGARASDPSAASDAGRSYVVFGSTSGAFGQTAVDQLGTSGNDALIGSAVSETLVAGAGNDTLTGNGGADVLYGGAGDDTLVLNADNVAKLVAGVTDSQLARMDGGNGIDTFRLDGANIALNLTAIANQGGSTPGSSSRMESIERVDLTGSGDNTLTLDLRDVLDMAGMNSFNNATGWADGTYNLAAGGTQGDNPEQRHQLVVDGDAGDAVNASGWGASVGTVTHSGVTYNVYHQGLHAQLLIDTAVTQTVL